MLAARARPRRVRAELRRERRLGVLRGRARAALRVRALGAALEADVRALDWPALEALARAAPTFDGFESAKLWVGARGTVMPLHYDSSDNW